MLLPWITTLTAALSLTGGAYGYVPAYASNTTDPRAILPPDLDGPTNVLRLASGPVSQLPSVPINLTYLAAGARTTGQAKGALSVFSIDQQATTDTTGPSTLVPWVALVSCEQSTTVAKPGSLDIVQFVTTLGATAIVFYSESLATCVLDESYRNVSVLNRPIDIYALTGASDSNFTILQSDIQKYTRGFPSDQYNATLLLSLSDQISQAINTGHPNSNNFLLATISAWNATSHGESPPDPSAATNTSGDNNGGGPGRKPVPMVILYVVTGVVSFLFCLIIASGAVRAIRHPERYGPRSGVTQAQQGGGAPQTRTQGLSRAILDTFAVVRFRAPVQDTEAHTTDDSDVKENDSVKPRSLSMDKAGWELVHMRYLGNSTDGGRESIAVVFDPAPASPTVQTPPARQEDNTAHEPRAGPSSNPRPSLDTAAVRPRPPTNSSPSDPPVLPSAIGRETCPICIADFQDDEPLRVLPCVGQHRFHQTCVDPWLLELSSSCPLCRQDFAALESMLAGEGGEHGQLTPGTEHPQEGQGSGASRASHGGRFSRYIRLARRRTRERRNAHGPPLPSPERHSAERRDSNDVVRETNIRRYAEDPTDPYMAVVPVTL